MTSTRYLLLDRISVQGANGLSSPLTYGFPALTGFVGFGHALGRRLREHIALNIDGVLVTSHNHKVHRFRPHRYADYTFVQSRNPVLRSGKTAAIVEQIKTDLTVSLVFRLRLKDSRILEDCEPSFAELVSQTVLAMRLCGGSIFDFAKPVVLESLEDVSRALLPGFVLNDGSDRLIRILERLRQRDSNATGLDALLELNTLYRVPKPDAQAKEQDEGGGAPIETFSGSERFIQDSLPDLFGSNEPVEEPVKWSTEGVRRWGGWYVPMPVGYQSLTATLPSEAVVNSRSPHYSNEFVESVYGLGKWEFPTRIDDIGECFWWYDFERQSEGLFLLTQEQP